MRQITKREFIEFINPDYYRQQDLVNETDRLYQAFRDSILMNDDEPIVDTKPERHSLGVDISHDANGNIIVGDYIIMANDWKGQAPKGKSWEVDGKWYYDYEAAMSIAFSDDFRLPTQKEWEDICNLLDNDLDKLNLGLNGIHDGISASSDGSLGYYWSSTYYNTNNAYTMSFYSGSVHPKECNRKQYGFAVRCLKNNI